MRPLVRRNPEGDGVSPGVTTISPIEASESGLRDAMAETRTALVNSDKRMKALEFRLQEATRLLSEQSTETARAREDLRRAVESQQFTQTMLLTFIAFTAGAGLFLTYFKRDR